MLAVEANFVVQWIAYLIYNKEDLGSSPVREKIAPKLPQIANLTECVHV